MENLLLDGAMLVLTLFLMRKRICVGRVLLAAGFGAAASTFMLVAGLQFGMIYMVTLLVAGIVMMRIAIRQRTWHEVMLGMVYYFTLVFTFSKLHQAGEWIAGRRVNGIVLVFLVIGMMCVALLYLIYQNRISRKKLLYCVTVEEQGHSVEIKALLDTGNTLTEPFSGKPVSVIESEVWRKVMEEPQPQQLKVIPFHSIGQEHGILRGLEIDKLIIWTGDRKIVQRHAMIALYEGKLSSDRSYQMILNQGLLI